MPNRRPPARSVPLAALVCALALTACNNQTPPAKVGSGAGQTDNAGAPSGRVTPESDPQRNGGGG